VKAISLMAMAALACGIPMGSQIQLPPEKRKFCPRCRNEPMHNLGKPCPKCGRGHVDDGILEMAS